MGVLQVLLFDQNPKKVPSSHTGGEGGRGEEESAGGRAGRYMSLTARWGAEPRLINPAGPLPCPEKAI